MTFDLGDSVALTATARAADGAAVDAGGVVLTITLPDGTTESPEVANPPATTGEYVATYLPTLAGLHSVRWVFTDPASAHTDVFDVRPALPRQIMSLADAKEALRKKSKVDDEELRRVIGAATGMIEGRIGTVVRSTFTERVAGGRGAIALSHRPVLEVTSVTRVLDGGVVIAPAGLDVDASSGVVWPRNGLFPDWPLLVTYTAGRPVVDPAIIEAAGIIIDHLWETRRGHSARPGMFGQQPEAPTNEQETFAYYAGYALPHRAAELLAPFELPGGFA